MEKELRPAGLELLVKTKFAVDVGPVVSAGTDGGANGEKDAAAVGADVPDGSTG